MSRAIALIAGFVCLLLAATWSTWSTTRAPADFTFCNAADVDSLDPAIAADSAAERVLNGVFEGLCVLDPQTLAPGPGVAENIKWNAAGGWECLSADGLTCTLRIRANAKWSDGSPLQAGDFVYSFRRVLDPRIAAPYPHLLGGYVVNAEKYNTPRDLAVGDLVEIELPLDANQPEGSNARGEIIRGILREKLDPDVFAVEVDGELRRFCDSAAAETSPTGTEPCRQLLLDFNEVGIRAIDEHTLELRLIRPNPAFLQVLAHVTLSPVNQHCLEAHPGADWTRPQNLVCNGPYVVAERRLRDRIRLTKNPQYWDRENITNEIVDALTVESPATMLNLFEAGQVDWIPSVPTALVDDLLRLRTDAVQSSPAFSTYFYVFNVKQPPFDDVHVRRAICQSINRQEIIDTALRGGQLPAVSLVPGGIAGYTSPQVPAEDRSAALNELQQISGENLANMKSGQLRLLYNTGDTHRLIAEMIQSQWRDTLGIDVSLENREFGAYRAAISAGDFDIARSGWTGDVSDPIAFLHMFASDSPFNDAGWSNADYNRLLDEASTESDPARRLELLAQAEGIVLQECPIIPIYHRVSFHLVRPGITGFYANPGDVHPLKWISTER